MYWSGPVLFDLFSKKKKFNPKLILQARKINEDMANYHAGKILKKLKKTKLNKILICGFSFKADCSDFRNSGVLKLYNYLNKKNIKIEIFDPYVDKKKVFEQHHLKIIKKIKKRHYDLVIIAVDHSKFKNLTKNSF